MAIHETRKLELHPFLEFWPPHEAQHTHHLSGTRFLAGQNGRNVFGVGRSEGTRDSERSSARNARIEHLIAYLMPSTLQYLYSSSESKWYCMENNNMENQLVLGFEFESDVLRVHSSGGSEDTRCNAREDTSRNRSTTRVSRERRIRRTQCDSVQRRR